MVGGVGLPNIVTQIKLYLVIPKLFISPAAERYAVGRLTRWRLGNSFSISKRNASHIDDRNDCPNRTEQHVPNISKYVSANYVLSEPGWPEVPEISSELPGRRAI